MNSLNRELGAFDKKSMTARYNELQVEHDKLVREVISPALTLA